MRKLVLIGASLGVLGASPAHAFIGGVPQGGNFYNGGNGYGPSTTGSCGSCHVGPGFSGSNIGQGTVGTAPGKPGVATAPSQW